MYHRTLDRARWGTGEDTCGLGRECGRAGVALSAVPLPLHRSSGVPEGA
jgi:hypothetical protein